MIFVPYYMCAWNTKKFLQENLDFGEKFFLRKITMRGAFYEKCGKNENFLPVYLILRAIGKSDVKKTWMLDE